ncbi:hypothetical protein CHS0354_010488 [Potamilus streckersoni]|uniref:Uncharacterized protein n=1 Tax=Potamilus streckersoni TaxID=2493646 RepID=A0AAE0RRI9_9BIVA|nr:hypothetical protein CHS0354_010488 [Potamilus streckersoni]
MGTNQKVFDGLTAWFSTSVSNSKKKLWSDGGGEETDFDSAMFMFSQDTQADDTKEIYVSEAYLDEHLAVFHPNFINQCWKAGDVKAVAVGKYFLPPKEIQQLVKKQMTFEWEIDGNLSDSSADDVMKTDKRDFVTKSQVTASENSTMANKEKPSTSSHGKANGVLRIEDLPKITGPLEDFIPGEGGCEIFHKKRKKTN